MRTLAFIAVVLAGCGDDGARPDGGGGEDGGPPRDSGGGTDGGGGVDSGGGEDAGPPLAAAVFIREEPQIPQTEIAVGITAPAPVDDTPGCTVMFFDPGAAPPVAMGFDGGDIQLSGIRGGDLTFRPMPDATAGVVYRPTSTVPDRVLMDGATLTAQGAGGPDFATFTITLPTPPAVALSQPPATGHTQDAGSSMQVRWSAGPGTGVIVTLIPTSGFPDYEPESGQWAFCNTTDGGSFDVPSSTLGPVAAGGGLFGRSVIVGVTRLAVATMGPDGSDQVVLGAATSTGALITLNE
jgi:hypothetical protein